MPPEPRNSERSSPSKISRTNDGPRSKKHGDNPCRGKLFQGGWTIGNNMGYKILYIYIRKNIGNITNYKISKVCKPPGWSVMWLCLNMGTPKKSMIGFACHSLLNLPCGWGVLVMVYQPCFDSAARQELSSGAMYWSRWVQIAWVQKWMLCNFQKGSTTLVPWVLHRIIPLSIPNAPWNSMVLDYLPTFTPRMAQPNIYTCYGAFG